MVVAVVVIVVIVVVVVGAVAVVVVVVVVVVVAVVVVVVNFIVFNWPKLIPPFFVASFFAVRPLLCRSLSPSVLVFSRHDDVTMMSQSQAMKTIAPLLLQELRSHFRCVAWVQQYCFERGIPSTVVVRRCESVHVALVFY